MDRLTSFLSSKLSVLALCVLSVWPLQAAELLKDANFSKPNSIDAWWKTDNVALGLRNGSLCAQTLVATKNPWDAIIGLNGFELKSGEKYQFSVSYSQGSNVNVKSLVLKNVKPWTPYMQMEQIVGAEQGHYTSQFLQTEDVAGGQIAFQFGGGPKGQGFCLDKVSLLDSKKAPERSVSTNVSLHVNQVGYLANGRKRANVTHPSQSPVNWQLVSADGRSVLQGQTDVFGFDESSGKNVHIINFSNFSKAGENYFLEVEGAQSDRFKIASSLYRDLRNDALSYFYLVRSGTDISEDIAGQGYGREAGHLADRSVGCLNKETSEKIYGQKWTCDYKLDVSGGWYDAGDFGKYVVNGGISVAQLMASYERVVYQSGQSSELLAANFLRLPNKDRKFPDILVEAKWELDFLLKMQVSDGRAYAGMAHHKVHGAKWSTFPLMPGDDNVTRVLHRPSTAATLNLAASAAMGARLFAPYDVEYAKKLLNAAQKAYVAARKVPDLIAPKTDGSHGGGDYDDKDVSDEFYWAEAELFITTGNMAYLDQLKKSKYWANGVFSSRGIDWRSVAGLARLQLALIPNKLPDADRALVQNSVVAAADNFLAIQSGEAFEIMYPAEMGFDWGSNQSVIQNMIVVAGAFDLTKNKRYLNAVRSGFDYILGRNVLGVSYVTGHGTRTSGNQHARIFAQSIDRSFPAVPKGALAGGANSKLGDKVAKEKLKNCAPQACYIDDPYSYSTNEIAINWNAALSWISSFLVDTSEL